MKSLLRLLIICETILFFFSACSSDSEYIKKAGKKEMILIPAGQFIMGSNNPQINYNEISSHTVDIDAYYIDKYEVTNIEYEFFILDGGYSKREYWSAEGWEFIQHHKINRPLGLGRPLFNEPNQPVVGVTWYEADAYCRWAGKRLPTEAEWEKAARGASGFEYPWGNQMEFKNVGYKISSGQRTYAVGAYPGNCSPYGVYDMAGNTWEWCAYEYSPQGGDKKVLRGGGWGSNSFQMRTTYRCVVKPDIQRFNVGFRCVRSSEKKTQ